MDNNLIEIIEEEMQTDEEDRDKQSQKLISIYQKASSEEKEVIDNVMMCLCGWSLDTLIKRI